MPGDAQTREMVLNIFRQAAVLQEGHFLLASGRHTDKKLTGAHIFEYPKYAVLVTALLAEQFKDDNITLVAGASADNARFAFELARQLGARAVFLERAEGKPSLRRDFAVRPDDRAVVADEILTVSGDVRAVCDLLRKAGVTVAGVAAVIARAGGGDPGAPLRAAVTMEIPAWEPAACPLCRAGKPLANPNIRRIR